MIKPYRNICRGRPRSELEGVMGPPVNEFTRAGPILKQLGRAGPGEKIPFSWRPADENVSGNARGMTFLRGERREERGEMRENL
ncbi:MAG TPA: hypothetical protein PKI34_06045 [Bacteroidales bacterium]|nr:hypothetical protein [Bacteroidales bacterium]